MNDYMFIFGRDSDLSLLEVVSYFKSRGVNYKINRLSKAVVIFSLQNLDAKKVVNDLGGTVKIGKVIKNFDEIDIFNKIKYGISVYNGNDKFLKEQLKKKFKQEKIKSIYKPSSRKEKVLMPTQSIKLDLEFLVFNKIIAKLIAVYNPLEYEKRDIKRPIQKPIHQISLRLAKILINLSHVKKNELLLDPFCGVGTILQEALLMDINVIGVDNSEDMINAARKNLKWLEKKNWALFNENSAKVDLDKKIDVIVTEPYLGPFLKKAVIDEVKAKVIISKLENMYFDVLFNVSKFLKDNGKVVIVVPRFKTNKGKRTLDFLKIIDKIDFKLSNQMKEVKIPILYNPPNSKLERLIYVLELK